MIPLLMPSRMPNATRATPETMPKKSLYRLKNSPINPASTPKETNAPKSPRENAEDMAKDFFVSLNATARYAGTNANPHGEVMVTSPAKKAMRKVTCRASSRSYAISLSTPGGTSIARAREEMIALREQMDAFKSLKKR